MSRYYRKIIRITGMDSPNVRLALEQIKLGIHPTGDIVIPGVLPWSEYQKRMATWDPVRIQIGIMAQFYEGSGILLYPIEWLQRSQSLYNELVSNRIERIAKAMGVDPAEGGDSTTFSIIDEKGLMSQISRKTPDTSVITSETINLIERFGLYPERVCFDAGGGGKQHVDRLRRQGYNVMTVAFGGAATPPPKRSKGSGMFKDKIDVQERRYVYKNKRAEMYGRLNLLLDPTMEPGFAIPFHLYPELYRQMSLVPLNYDDEGRLFVLPKRRKGVRMDLESRPTGNQSLMEIMGCSPDETDSLVLAVNGLYGNVKKITVGAM